MHVQRWSAEKLGTLFLMEIKHLHEYDRAVTASAAAMASNRAVVEFSARARLDDSRD
jgi:hypothetical protein